MPLKFTVNSDIQGTFLYTVSAIIEEENFEEEIFEGVGNLNVESSCKVSTATLKNGGYKFKFGVKLKYGSEFVTDSKIVDEYLLTVKRDENDDGSDAYGAEKISKSNFDVTNFEILSSDQNKTVVTFSVKNDVSGSYEYEIIAVGGTQKIIDHGVANLNQKIEKTILINDLPIDDSYKLTLSAKFLDGKQTFVKEKIADGEINFKGETINENTEITGTGTGDINGG